MKVPVDEIRTALADPAPKRKERPRSVSHYDGRNLEDMARRVLDGEHPARAAEACGMRPELGPHLVRTSQAYQAARTRVLAAMRSPKEAMMKEMATISMDNAYRGALVTDTLLRESSDPNVLARLAIDAMDRVGARAATKVDNTLRIELGEQTMELVGRALRDLPLLETLPVISDTNREDK